MVERYTSEEREKEKQKERRVGIPVPVWVIIVGLLVAFAGGIFIYRSFDEQYSEAASLVSRVGDSILATFFGQTPKFIYMGMEKNGEDYRLRPGDTFNLSYRDEFVIKEISTDDLFGKGITADIEGMGDDDDFRMLLNGRELVEKVINTGKSVSPEEYHILVKKNDQVIASIPVTVELTPQDWFRQAKNSGSVSGQIAYLERALKMKPDDSVTRKMLAQLYVKTG
ncbi:MAG: hypothetical protein JW736_09085, partial [Deltaproteobacteria bacterium]|nr:hypothetical protein [Deltaproteobacteria bacterium]